jgi:hypothetical protein
LGGFAGTVAAALATLVLGLVVPTHGALALGCSGELTAQDMVIGGEQPDLVVDEPCKVMGGTYYYRHVNIIAPAGKLIQGREDGHRHVAAGAQGSGYAFLGHSAHGRGQQERAGRGG